MATDLQIIVDDNSGAFSYSWSGGSNSSSPWVLSTLTQWYHATSWYVFSTTQTGTFVFTFNGKSNLLFFFVVAETIKALRQLSLVTHQPPLSHRLPPFKSTMGLPSASIMTTPIHQPTSSGSQHPHYRMEDTPSR